MKTVSRVFQLVFIVLILVTCKKDDELICPELSIEGAFPFSAPPNGPVLIKGTGFNQDGVTVRFGTQKADILENNESYISTKIPPGLLGVVEMSVSNAQGCLVTKNFEISPNPSTMPGSPPVYFIPPAGFAFPVQIPPNDAMYFSNFFDSSHFIQISSFRDGPVGGIELWKGEESPLTGTVNLPKNEINFKINRSVIDEELVGGFYTMILNDNGEQRQDNFFIAFSNVTGRQYLFKYEH